MDDFISHVESSEDQLGEAICRRTVPSSPPAHWPVKTTPPADTTTAKNTETRMVVQWPKTPTRLLKLGKRNDGELLMSGILINAERGGEFFIDTDRQAPYNYNSNILIPQSSGAFAGLIPAVGGFVMSCRVQGEGKGGKLKVQLAMRHVEDAAIFMTLAVAVDLTIEACRPFRRSMRMGNRHSC